MYEIRTEIEIDASTANVWDTLMAFDRYAEWNPFVRQLEGQPTVGSRLRAHLKNPGGTQMTVKPVVTHVEPQRRFAWLGNLMVKGLFDGQHFFELEPLDDTRSRFVHREEFRGLLLPFLRGMLDRDTRQGFERMNRALKARVEASN
ncbi:MAG: SRPBCC domain-containing protein [Myxococcales bacterium FL481]|nr:MAG: SRPBCC domain-containing protein [Myxococcales bacterium FL481]